MIELRKRDDALGYRYSCSGCGQPFEDYPKRVPAGLQQALQVLEDPPPLVSNVLRQLTDTDVDPDELDPSELDELDLEMPLRGAILLGPCCRDLVQ